MSARAGHAPAGHIQGLEGYKEGLLLILLHDWLKVSPGLASYRLNLLSQRKNNMTPSTSDNADVARTNHGQACKTANMKNSPSVVKTGRPLCRVRTPKLIIKKTWRHTKFLTEKDLNIVHCALLATETRK